MRLAKLTAVAAAALLLAGCSLLPFGNDDPTTGGSEGGGGSGGTGQTGGDQGGEGDDTGVSTGAGRLPASWPDSIYVPDAPISSAVEAPGSWVVVVEVDDPMASFTEISAQLTANGFTAISELVGESSIGVYESELYQVNILANDDSGTPSVTYAVTQKAGK